MRTFEAGSLVGSLSREAWGSLLNPLADLLKRLMGSKMLQPPGGPSLAKGGHVRHINSEVFPAGPSIGQRLERCGLGSLGLDKGQGLN